MGLTYREAGVNIDAAERTKRRIRDTVSSTFGPEVLSDVGLFGGLFRLDLGEFEDPVLVASTDGVGTKLKVAFLVDRHDTVGVDLVHHCANDIVVQGARSLFFLDYLAMGEHREEVAAAVVEGVARGCRNVGCALLGGEMAELPEFYRPGEYDLAGTIVGVVDRARLIDGSRVRSGDVILGIGSDGLHTNGYSLARKVFFEVAKWDVDRYVPELGRSLGEELLRPHRSYVRPLLRLMEEGEVHALAHITGGGLPGNLPRALPEGCSAEIRLGSWEVPSVFRLIGEIGEVEEGEMFRTFNMGIGMAVVVGEGDVDRAREVLEAEGERVWEIGRVVPGKGVQLVREGR
ncbi:MAG TPA: phosphoribosylformylglycinamidine cyclo-ligase [Candidatus Latescibacteria bacterium]|nr:phosphoribosylformylglycinamidine cyclo-ligase [Candidatus Latescibacterota bacterium]